MKERNFGLDIMRAVSIWLVILQHGGVIIPVIYPLRLVFVGVEIFFVLSGFLIGGILFRELEKGEGIIKTLKTFWIRRWLRILPLYYAVIFFKFIFISSSIGWNILYYVFFLQNNFYGIDFHEVTWSLVIEEWFYIVAPIFLIIATRLFKADKMIFISMLLFIVAVNLLRIWYVVSYNPPLSAVNGNFVLRFDALFLGVIVAFLKHRGWKLFELLKSKWTFICGLIVMICYLAYYRSLIVTPIKYHNIDLIPRTLGFFILPFSIALIIPWVSTIKLGERNNLVLTYFYKFITLTSILTYAIYLIHPFVFELKIVLVIKLAITYGISWLVYTFFENPILKFREKLAKT